MSKTVAMPSPENQAVLESLQVRIAEPCELERCHQLLDEHHYLKSPKPVGERLYYVVTDAQGQWLAVMIFAAAAKHLRARDQWMGWTDAQREKRLSLVVNNIRFLLLPDKTFPNLGTKSLRLILSRLGGDWPDQVWPSGAGGGNLCRSGEVLRHGLYGQRLAGVGQNRRFGAASTRLLCSARQAQAAICTGALSPRPAQPAS